MLLIYNNLYLGKIQFWQFENLYHSFKAIHEKVYWNIFCVLPRKIGPDLPYLKSTQLSEMQLNLSRCSGQKFRGPPNFISHPRSFNWWWAKCIGCAFKINPKSGLWAWPQPPSSWPRPPSSLAWPITVASYLVCGHSRHPVLYRPHSSQSDIRACPAFPQNPARASLLTQSRARMTFQGL